LGYRIPEEKIAEVKNSADIVEIISETVRLKKAGRNYLGLCPFHTEKTPSFSVSPDKQIFHCFGCGVGGNVITFLVKQEGFSFPEAVRALAQRYGIDIPPPQASPGQQREMKIREELLAVNQEAMQFFRNALKNSPPGQAAGRYLLKRGLTQETIDRYHLGYAPDGWENLIRHLRKKGISPEKIEKSGLAVPRKRGRGHYDRFRNRIIFPIFSQSQQIIGFGGRVMDESLPKYLNSPETPLYNKSRSLYGLHNARSQCRRQEAVIIVEGYFDLLALHQNGVTHSVATLGTALTDSHVKILRGCIGQNGRALLVFDSDEAGMNAARRSIAVFDNAFVNAQILVLQEGHDPDSFIQAFGIDAFMEAAARASSSIEFLLESAVRKYGLSLDGKLRIIAELLEPMASMGDAVKRALHIRLIAERLDINEDAVVEKLKQHIKRGASSNRMAGRVARTRPQPHPADADAHRLERHLIAMMLQFPEMIAEMEEQHVLEHFENDDLQLIGHEILRCYKRVDQGSAKKSAHGNRWVSEVVDTVADHLEGLVTHLANTNDSWSAEGCRKLIGQFLNLRHENRMNQSLEIRIKEAEASNDEKLLERLLKEKQKLAVQRSKQRTAMLENN
jgi:DNA primase